MPDRRPLTDSEGAILTLVLREGPVTAYQVGKSFVTSPVHTLNTSKGKLYPLIRRLNDRGLLAAEDVAGDQRGTQRFSITPAGREALKRWILLFRAEHELLHDPLRKKIQGFELLSKKEQQEWLESAQSTLRRKLRAVEQWPPEAEGPFGDLVKESAKAALRARLDWLKLALSKVTAQDPGP
jgi:DNA-binding PadR family transcriptional regulator